MIVYFTGTGNSRYCAELLADQLCDQTVDAFHFIRDGIAADLCSDRPWIFVAPTYGWRLPRIFADFIRSGSFMGCRAAYFVMTCGSEIGNAERSIRSLCVQKGFDFHGVLEVIMPENYVAMFPVPDAQTAARIIADARPVLETGVDCIRRGANLPAVRHGAADALKSGPVNRLFYAFCVKAKAFYATEACTRCGKCGSVCPLNNIRFQDGRPLWGDACTHCMACISGCPKEAIEYGAHSRGKPRYRCPSYTPDR